MGEPFQIALVALGLSILVSAARVIDWFIHSDPKAMAQTARVFIVALALLSLPLLAILLLKEQWTAAATLAAVIVLVPAVLGRRLWGWLNFPGLHWANDCTDPITNNSAPEKFEDPELVRRSVAVLEAFLRRGGGAVPRPEIEPPAIQCQQNRSRGTGARTPGNSP